MSRNVSLRAHPTAEFTEKRKDRVKNIPKIPRPLPIRVKPGGSVLIVENQNTCDENSPICQVDTNLFAQALEQVVW